MSNQHETITQRKQGNINYAMVEILITLDQLPMIIETKITVREVSSHMVLLFLALIIWRNSRKLRLLRSMNIFGIIR